MKSRLKGGYLQMCGANPGKEGNFPEIFAPKFWRFEIIKMFFVERAICAR
jgi:hypothetical protein